MNKRIILFILFACFSLVEIKAQVIASESFDYTVGTTLSTSNGGAGWGGAWELVGGDDKMIVADSIKNFRTGFGSGTGLLMDLDAAGKNVRLERRLAAPIEDDGEFWIAFAVDFVTVGSNVFNVALVDVDATAASGPGGLKMIIGKFFNPDDWGAAAAQNTNPGRVVGQRPEGVHWMVTKVSFGGVGVNDTLRLFLNPDPMIEPTNDAADVTFIGGALDGGFNGIMIRTEANPTIVTKVDDLILGRS